MILVVDFDATGDHRPNETTNMQLNQFNVRKEFVRRRELAEHGVKLGPTQAYANAYVIRDGQGDGEGKIVGYALTEDDARTWVEEKGKGGKDA